MVYVVSVSYVKFIFTDSEEAFGFARTAKKTQKDQNDSVSVDLYSEEEWAKLNKKEEQ